MTTDQQLRTAIAERRLIEFSYGSPGRRVAEPHDYGRIEGKIALLVYQIRGASRGPLPNWRMLHLDKIQNLTMLDETFAGSRGPAHAQHKDWDEVFARVE